MFADLTDKSIQPQSIDVEHVPEFSVSWELKQEIQKMLEEEEDSFARVFEHSAVVQTDKNYVFFSNHWLYLSVLCKKYAEALKPYADFFDKKIRGNMPVLKSLAHRKFDDPELVELMPDSVDRERMINFIMADPSFRPGKCLINGEDGNKVRSTKDIMGSCVLKKISVPDASSGYLGNLICHLTNHPSVYACLQEEISEQLRAALNDATDLSKSISPYTGYQSTFERNRILFGAPGTGKSFTVNRQAMELIGASNVPSRLFLRQFCRYI